MTGVGCTLSVKQKIICIFTSPFDCWSLAVYYVLGTVTVWPCYLSSVSSFLIGLISKVFLLFWGTNAFPKFKLFFLWLCWFLESAGVGYSFYLSYFVFSFAAPSLFVLVWLELLLLLLSLLLLYQFCLRPFYVLLLLLLSLACLFACLGFLSTELFSISAVLFDIRLPII